MERNAVRLLAEPELAALLEACVVAKDAKERDMAHRVSDLSRKIAADGDAEFAETLRFLSGVLSPHVGSILKIEAVANPFWVTPSGLSDSELELLKQVADSTRDLELKARCADFIWLRARDWKYGGMAVDAYLGSAFRLRDPEHWSGAAARYERAATLAASLGKKNSRYERVIKVIEEYLQELDASDPLFMSCRLMEILLAQKEGDRARYAVLAEKAARAAETRGNHYVAQFYWDIAAKWHLARENAEGVRAVRVAAAETAVREAEGRAQGESASFLNASNILQGAISMMQKAGGPRPRIDELFLLLKEYEAKGLGELKRFGGSIDLTDLAEMARQDVAGKPLPEAIAILADMVRLPKREKVKADVLKAAKDFPISHLFGGVVLDSGGAAIAGRGSVSGEEEDETSGVLSLMHENVVRTFSVTALGQIDPARRQILDEHDVREIDLSVIVQSSWFVSPGRDVLFTSGLHAGMHGDLVVALHLLVPQIEASLRWNLRRRGSVTTKLNRDGFQEEMDLNQLLATAATGDLLGEDVRFALQSLLTSRFGFNLRNKLAHGLLDLGAMHSTVSLFFWAVVLMICVRAQIVPATQDASAS